MSVQFVVVTSEFSCNTRFMEGTIQEMAQPPALGVMLKSGAGTNCDQ